MPLNLRLKTGQATDHTIPIDLRGLSVGINANLDASQIAELMICVGKRSVPMKECFAISGDAGSDREFILSGDLSNVHSIGRGITGGSIFAESTKVGRHVGTAMSGGNITVGGDVGGFLGAEMTGGTIRVTGDAGDFVAAALEGAKYGMNRGEIFVEGNAGVGLGKRMRRGTIVVGGDVGELAAWSMLAGTIVVLGSASAPAPAKTAAGIVRGTVILAGDDQRFGANNDSEVRDADGSLLGAAFSTGNRSSDEQPQIVRFLAHWLSKNSPKSLAETVEQKLLGGTFVKYNGGELNQNRAEIFVRLPDASAT
ncbi:formylmethanofuran dehydrogenase subunit C [bacterium]|nr:formylmethanofuran dehydrogenase subunit C [bacterium]